MSKWSHQPADGYNQSAFPESEDWHNNSHSDYTQSVNRSGNHNLPVNAQAPVDNRWNSQNQNQSDYSRRPDQRTGYNYGYKSTPIYNSRGPKPEPASANNHSVCRGRGYNHSSAPIRGRPIGKGDNTNSTYRRDVGGVSGRASGMSKTLHSDRCSQELLEVIKNEYEQCWLEKEGKRSPSKVKIDPNSIRYPPPLTPGHLPQEPRWKLGTNSWVLQSDIHMVYSYVLRIEPSQDKLDERYLRNMIRKMKRVNKQKMVDCLGDDFVLAGPLIYTFGERNPVHLEIVENKGKDREYRIEITPKGPLTIANLELIHQRLIYKQISQSAMKAQNYFHQKNLWIAELPEDQEKMTVKAKELFTDIDLVLGCRSNVIHATDQRRLQLIVSPGTKKQSALTVGDMLLKMKNVARDDGQYQYFTRCHIVGRNTMLTYRNSATQTNIQIAWDKCENHLIRVTSKNTILEWMSARLDFVPKECVKADFLTKLIKGDKETEKLPIAKIELDQDRYMEIVFSEQVHKSVIEKISNVVSKTLRADEDFRVRALEARPGFNFDLVGVVGHKTTILNFVESRYDVKYEERYFGLPLLFPKQYPNSKKDPDFFLPGFCKLTGFDNENDHTRRKVQAMCKMPKFMNCNRHFVKALMKAPHLQIGTNPDAVEPMPLVTRPLKLDPVKLNLMIRGQPKTITSENLASWWQNVSGFITGNSELKKWAVLYEPNDTCRSAKTNFIRLVNELRTKRQWPESFLPWPDELEHEFSLDREFLEMLKNRVYDMILILTRPETQYKYWLTSVIQREACTKTQFLRLGSLSRKDAVWNSMEQVFYKAGCQLFTVEPQKYCSKLMKNTLVIGIDVCHDDTRRGRFPSIASFCYFLKPFSTHYRDIHAINYFMSPREDIIPFTVMKDMVAHAINHYAQHNQEPPSQILYFRDSIGETRYPLLKQTEEKGMIAAFNMCPSLKGREEMPKIEIVICAKRHPHRFDLESIRGGSDGIVIDQEVVSSDFWQFMIQHCRGSQPTQYNVLCDGWKVQNHVLKIKAFYEAIHTLTFCYTIAKKGVKLPAQLMWAQHFSQWQNEQFQRWINSLDDLVTPLRTSRPRLYFGGRIQDSYFPTSVVSLFPYPPEEKPKGGRGGYRRGRGRGRGRGRSSNTTFVYRGRGGRGRAGFQSYGGRGNFGGGGQSRLAY